MRGLTEFERRCLILNGASMPVLDLTDAETATCRRLVKRGLMRTWVEPAPDAPGFEDEWFETNEMGHLAARCVTVQVASLSEGNEP